MHPRECPSIIHAEAGFPSTFGNFTSISETFRQFSVRPQDLPSTSINFLSVRGKHFVRKLDLQSSSINILCSHGTFCPLVSTFRAAVGPTVNFPCIRGTYRQLSVHLRDHSSTFRTSGDVPSTSVNFLCVRGTIRQIFVCQRNIVSSSINIPCGCRAFHQLPSTFHASA